MARTLLLADDSVTIQRVVELTFADEDIDVVAVSDGDQAIARINDNPPDIVLADIGMPGRTGYEVAYHVKRSARLAHIPVVLLTGAFEPVDEARAAAAGCDAVMAKPFEPQAVIARVKELLSKGDGHGGADPQLVATAPRTADVARLDTYFEELGAAFASLPAHPVDTDAPGHDARREDAASALASTPVTAATPAGSEPAPDSGASSPLADAFVALLAAEQRAGGEAVPDGWFPRPVTPMSDETIEEITRKVLERLSRTEARAQVAGIVSTVAERLVREEIERIKSSIT